MNLSFTTLCTVGLFARLSYALARTPVLPLFALYLGAGPEIIGFVVGVSTITGILFKLPSGAISDIIGRIRTMLIGLVIFAAMPFSYLLIRDYSHLIVIRFIHGLATAIYGPVSMAVVADIAGKNKGTMLSWFSSITIIGNLIGAPIGGFIIHSMSGDASTLSGFHTAYIVSGIAGMVSLLIALRFLNYKEGDNREKNLKGSYRRFFSGIKEVMNDKRILITSNMEGLQNMTVGALEAFLPVYAVKVAGLNEFQAGLLWGVQVFITIISKPIMGKTSDRYGRKPIIITGMLLCALSFGLIPLLRDFYTLMLSALLFGLGEAFVTSSSAALVAAISRERHFGTAMGTFGTIFDIGHASGPILAGFLIARLDYLYSFWIISLMLLLSLPIFIYYVKVEK